MKKRTSPQNDHKELSSKREAYEAPAIVYEGQITTRSGSPVIATLLMIQQAVIFDATSG